METTGGVIGRDGELSDGLADVPRRRGFCGKGTSRRCPARAGKPEPVPLGVVSEPWNHVSAAHRADRSRGPWWGILPKSPTGLIPG